MSDTEVAAFLAASGEACARFYVRADETAVTGDCTRGADRSGLKVLAGSMLVGSALALAVLAPNGNQAVALVRLEDLVARPSAPVSGPGSPSAKVGVVVRVQGKVPEGSISIGKNDAWYTLVSEDAPGLRIHVHHAGVLPDGFAEVPRLDLPVVVEGVLQPNGTFEAMQASAFRLRQGCVMKDHDAGR